VTTATYKPPPRRRLRFSFGSRELAGLIWQILVIAIAVAIIVWLWSNAVHNLSARRISTGFAFLGREAGMPIADTWLAYSPKDTYLWAFVVGVANTLRVAAIGIVLATILGTMIGIARLSANWLLSRLAAVYVEILRDIPLLLQLLFWYVLMQGLPRHAPPGSRSKASSFQIAASSCHRSRSGLGSFGCSARPRWDCWCYMQRAGI
jgi:general L-amino acid transport system permease protein